MPPAAACTRKLKNREKIESNTPSNSQPHKPIPHSTIGFLHVLSPWWNNVHIHHFNHYISLPQPPYPSFPLKNGVLFPYRFLKPIYFRHLWIYLIVNLPRHIATLGSVLLLTASRTITQIFKFTSSPPHLLMRLQGPQIRSFLLF